MTALARVLARLRGPWVAPDPARHTRRASAPTVADLRARLLASVEPCSLCPPDTQARDDLHATLRAEGTRYDIQWPSVRAAESGGWAGGDLAAMAAPWPGRSCLGCGYTPADTSECVVGACVPGYHELALIPAPGMARDDLGTYAEPVTDGLADFGLAAVLGADAFDRIMADLAALDREIDTFDDGRAYEAGSQCRTDSAALRRAGEHLADGADGARRAALVLAGYAGAEAWAV